jgi:hypothetical protein
MAAIKERGLSLGLGVTHMKSYLQMKHDFKKWFTDTASNDERNRFISFIENNIDMLMQRSLELLEVKTQENFINKLQYEISMSN